MKRALDHLIAVFLWNASSYSPPCGHPYSLVGLVSVHTISCALGHFSVPAVLFFPPAFSSSLPLHIFVVYLAKLWVTPMFHLVVFVIYSPAELRG